MPHIMYKIEEALFCQKQHSSRFRLPTLRLSVLPVSTGLLVCFVGFPWLTRSGICVGVCASLQVQCVVSYADTKAYMSTPAKVES